MIRNVFVRICVLSLVSIMSIDTVSAGETMLYYERSPRCDWYDAKTVRYGTAGCDQFPTFSPAQIIDVLSDYIIDVSSEYDATSRLFDYQPSDLIFQEGFDLLIQQAHDAIHNDGVFLRVPTLLIAYEQLQDIRIVASTRDTTIYGPCRKQNYDVAMRLIDGQILKPGDRLNMNALIANQPDYCTGGGRKYLFYSGVCGGSTQVFWNAVLHPGLEVIQRHSHGKWYAGFYGSSVMGDDSSIYENAKKLIIQNTSESNIIFKTFERPRDGNTVLLSVQYSNQDWTTIVTKQQTGKQSALLTATITDTDGTTLNHNERTSKYYGIDTSIDETAGIDDR